MAEEEKKTVKKAPAKKTTTAKKAPAKKPAAKKAEKKETETVKEEAVKEVETKEAKKAAKQAAKEAKKAPVAPEKPAVTEAHAFARDVRVTPRKVRLVIDLVRGKDLATAYAILDNCPKRCAHDIKKLIQSAEANAVNNFKMEASTLYIASITANDAVKLKRRLPRAKGSASGLIKRWSHVFVTLKNKEAK